MDKGATAETLTEALTEVLTEASFEPEPEPKPEPELDAANTAIIDATADVVFRAFQMWRTQERKTSLAGAIEAALQATVQKKRLERKRRRLAFERKLAEARRERREKDRADQERAVKLLMNKRAKIVRGIGGLVGASDGASIGASSSIGPKPATRAEKKRAQLEAKLEQEREIAEATQSYEGARAALKASTAAQKAAGELAKTRSRTETLRAVKDITSTARADGSDAALLAGIEQLQALPFVDKAAQQLVLKNIDVLQGQLAATATAAQQAAAAQHKTSLDAAALTAAHERRQRKRDVKLALQQREAERAVVEARDESARNAEVSELVDRAAALAGTADFRTEGQRLLGAALEKANGTSSEAAGLRRLILNMMATARKSSVKDAQRDIADARARFHLETPRVSDAFRAQLSGIVHDFTESPTEAGRARARERLVELRDAALEHGDVEPKLITEISATIKTLDAGELANAKAALRHVDRAARQRAAAPPPPSAAQQDAEAWLRGIQTTLLSEEVYKWSAEALRDVQREIRSVCAAHDMALPVDLLRSIDQRVKGMANIVNKTIGGHLKLGTKMQMEQQKRQLGRLQDRFAAAKFDTDARAASAVHVANEDLIAFLATSPSDREIAEKVEEVRGFLRANDVKEEEINRTVKSLMDTLKSQTRNLIGRAQLAAKGEAAAQAQALRRLQDRAAASKFDTDARSASAVHVVYEDLIAFLATSPSDRQIAKKIEEVQGFLRANDVKEEDINKTMKSLMDTFKSQTRNLMGRAQLAAKGEAGVQAQALRQLQGGAAAAKFNQEVTALDAQYRANVELTTFFTTPHTSDEVTAKMNEVRAYLRTHGVLEGDINTTLKPLQEALKTLAKGLKGHLSIKAAADANAQAEEIKRKKDALVRRQPARDAAGLGTVDMDDDDDDEYEGGGGSFARGGVAGGAGAPVAATDIYKQIQEYRKLQQDLKETVAEGDEDGRARRENAQRKVAQIAAEKLEAAVREIALNANSYTLNQLRSQIASVVTLANSQQSVLSKAQSDFFNNVYKAKEDNRAAKVRELAAEYLSGAHDGAAAASHTQLGALKGVDACKDCDKAVCIVAEGRRRGLHVFLEADKLRFEGSDETARMFQLEPGERFALCADKGALGRQVISVLGPSGVGKSTAIRDFLVDYRKVFPGNAIVMFSQKESDTSIDPFVPLILRIPLSIDIKNLRFQEFQNTCVVFDDIEGLGSDKKEKEVERALLTFRNILLTVGRSAGITVVMSSHVATAGEKSKVQLQETVQTMIFPGHSGYTRLLKTYFDFKDSVVQFIRNELPEYTRVLCLDKVRNVLFTDREVMFTSDWYIKLSGLLGR